MVKNNKKHFDVFNGDADGIISLIQLRLAEPKDSVLITGVKRDIQLIEKIDLSRAQSMTVLDISMEKNVTALEQALAQGIATFYVDHHRSGEIPTHQNLTPIINTDANTCTALLVNEYLKGQYANWAVAAAFGDNMTASAIALSNQIGLSEIQQQQLSALGTYINYNGYGQAVEDLHFHPAELFKALLAYSDPFDLILDEDSIFSTLERAYHEDMKQAQHSEILVDNEAIKVVLLDDAPWSRRVSGVFGNELANESPDKAHGVLTYNRDGESYTVSVRAPLKNKQGADEVCIQFATGGGRSGAAGINKLPLDQREQFISTLFNYYN
ncbi:DHH family phosphoesterase [Thalassotalea atypica]|uniref:DHH family phosphoesterase n=1 Tax=Thalassotalea atypica TaxID=2054316 RepID=UPI002572D179|nr:DHH family phosphoesterase [Thalassotalea atypica]